MEDSWINTLRDQRNELLRIADWASQCQLGRIRDYCRLAAAAILDDMNHRQQMLDLMVQAE